MFVTAICIKIHWNGRKIELEELELSPSLKGGIKAALVLFVMNDPRGCCQPFPPRHR